MRYKEGFETSSTIFIILGFKERILSVYALHLLKRANHEPLKEDEFIQFFVKFFEEKSYTIKGGTIEDAFFETNIYQFNFTRNYGLTNN